MMLGPLKPLLIGICLLVMLMGLVWALVPKPASPFVPTWSSSVRLYHRAHAVWLDLATVPGCNLPLLNRVLIAASQAKQVPELVIYTIPLRDLGQSSEGGFGTEADYLTDSRQNAARIAEYVKATPDKRFSPIVYLEPDSIPLAVQYRIDHHDNPESVGVYASRIRMIQALRAMYQQAGAKVFLDGAHSGWFDFQTPAISQLANALNEAGIGLADGLVTNVSNRQPVFSAENPNAQTEIHYLNRLLPLLDKRSGFIVTVDTSRNGGATQARQYFLKLDGALYDSEIPAQRLVGRWESIPANATTAADVRFLPFFGHPKLLSRLLTKEKYTWDAKTRILKAPAWLDPVGDVQLGPAPTNRLPVVVSGVIQRYRYIKPPDDCDGSLNCPPGASKSEIIRQTQLRQKPAS